MPIIRHITSIGAMAELYVDRYSETNLQLFPNSIPAYINIPFQINALRADRIIEYTKFIADAPATNEITALVPDKKRFAIIST